MPSPFNVTCPNCQRWQWNITGHCHYCGASLYAELHKGATTNVRYPITFTVDANNFEHARRIARSWRKSLRDAEEFSAYDAKLLKLRDPAASATRPSPGFDANLDNDPDND